MLRQFVALALIAAASAFAPAGTCSRAAHACSSSRACSVRMAWRGGRRQACDHVEAEAVTNAGEGEAEDLFRNGWFLGRGGTS